MPVKEKVGIVVSNKMQKTVVVKSESRFSHPIYSKIVVKTKKYLVCRREKVKFSSEPEVNSRILAYRSPSTAPK